MSYPNPPSYPPTPSMRRRPKFWVAIGLTAFLFGSCGIGVGASDTDANAKKERKDRPTVTATVTETAKPSPAVTVTKTAKAEPAPTVTITHTTESTVQDDGAGSASVYYSNCSEVRAAGAAPIRRGEPGYGSHLDRDGDGIACDT